MSIDLHRFKNESYFRTHTWRNFSMNAVDLIDPKYNPQHMDVATFKWHKQQLIQFQDDNQMYYAIFYITLDGHMPQEMEAYNYHRDNGMDTFVTTNETKAKERLEAHRKGDKSLCILDEQN